MKYLYPLLMVMLVGCGSSVNVLYKVDLIPIDREASWSNGNQKLQFTGKRCTGEICFKGMREEYLEFAVLVKNISPDTLFVDPADFFYSTPVTNNDTGVMTGSYAIRSVDAETMISEAQKRKSVLAVQKNPYTPSGFETGVNVVAGVLDFVSIFTSTRKTPEEREKEDRQRDERHEQEEERERDEKDWQRSHEAALRDVNRTLDYWSETALRKNTLLPGTDVSGNVCFPIKKRDDTLSFHIKISEDAFIIKYQQKLLYL